MTGREYPSVSFHAVLEISFFFMVASTWVVAEPVANICDIVVVELPPFVRFLTKHNSIWSKALIIHLTIWNCVLSYQQKNTCSDNWHVFSRNYFHNRNPR